MFTQFFGNFLLNQNLVANWQLSEALELQKDTKLKLGVLAINAGFMTADQVNTVHSAQQRMDKRFGDIAVEMRFVTHDQIETLLNTQKTGHLLLGQALVDKGYMTNGQFEKALNDYKKLYSINDKDFSDVQNGKIEQVIKTFYHFNNFKYAKVFTEYVSLMFKNIIRFIGDDFSPLEPVTTNEFEAGWTATQTIKGKYNIFTAIDGNEEAFIEFSSRFAGEKFIDIDEYSQASVAEFLNLHNGLFTVNISNEQQAELELAPQTVQNNKIIKTSSEMFCMPICFPFGTINILLSNDIPKIV